MDSLDYVATWHFCDLSRLSGVENLEDRDRDAFIALHKIRFLKIFHNTHLSIKVDHNTMFCSDLFVIVKEYYLNMKLHK